MTLYPRIYKTSHPWFSLYTYVDFMFSGCFINAALRHTSSNATFKKMQYQYLFSRFWKVTVQIDKLSLDNSKRLFRTTIVRINNWRKKGQIERDWLKKAVICNLFFLSRNMANPQRLDERNTVGQDGRCLK